MFRSLLIANRGEIACRVIDTARRLGVRTIAVYSDADAGARHVQMADEAYPIGAAPSRDSYLNVARILAAAQSSGAEAVHPGYGFLSESADFAQACVDAGLVFIGPPPAAIRAMGSKSAAKALMDRAGVPLVPGYHGDDQDPALLAQEAGRIGYPVLIKASAGGGGKGMRAVEQPSQFGSALALAKGEALASFGDDRVLIERYLARPRHIEVQVFADRHGNVVHLFERDCSIQRRHQKVVEEAPAPGMTSDRRESMGQAACAAARAIGYEGAGTVEFIVEDDQYFFMEMNTRLQVEHRVTEMITGQDLVEWQLLVAAGEMMPKRQNELAIDGHAIEVRLYAEDPARDYRPSIGSLLHLRLPPPSPTVRVDAGVREGDAITVHYDPMIAKLVVWGAGRDEAVRRLQDALAAIEIVGVQTNLGLLRAIAASQAFGAAELDTGFLGRHPELLPGADAPVPAVVLAAAAEEFLSRRSQSARAIAASRGDPHSPWAAVTAWRLNGRSYQDIQLRDAETKHDVRIVPLHGGALRVTVAGQSIEVRREGDRMLVDGVRRRVSAGSEGGEIWVFVDGAPFTLQLVDTLAPPMSAGASDERLLAPMPGRIVSLHTEPGATVAKGDVLVVLEAMKVQMRLTAPRDGSVASVHGQPGELVDEGVELVRFALIGS